MTFFDPPPDWTRRELPQLRDLFAQAYVSLVDAQELAVSAGVEPQYFPINLRNMRQTWFELINIASRQGKLRAMVEKAAADGSISGYQQRFAEMLGAHPLVATEGPSLGADWWKGDDRDANTARKIRQQKLLAQRSRLIDIHTARQVTRMARSVARLTMRFADDLTPVQGTGFLIQPDLILTNEHNVFDEKLGTLLSVDVEFDYEERFSGPPLVCRGRADTIQMNKANDWAVIQLEQPVEREPLALGTSYNIGTNDPVIIIQHPTGAFKKFALDMLSIRYVDHCIVQYLADTQNGSSGSPVFNIAMHIIALHHAEAEVAVPPVQPGGIGTVEWRNEGIRIERVMQDLSQRNIPYLTLPQPQ